MKREKTKQEDMEKTPAGERQALLSPEEIDELFISAAGRGSANMGRAIYFLSLGANPDAERLLAGRLALSVKLPELALALIKAGAPLEKGEGARGTALHAACSSGGTQGDNEEAQLSVITALINAGANVNARDALGETPLMRAAGFATPRVVKALIDAGAELEALDSQGRSAYLSAAVGMGIKTAKTLLTAGADWRRKTHEGQSALDLARQESLSWLEASQASEFLSRWSAQEANHEAGLLNQEVGADLAPAPSVIKPRL